MRHPLQSLTFCLTAFCVLAGSSTPANAQAASGAPAFPKYKIMGVVYAPPGSSSFVTYGYSNMVGSTDTMSTTNATTNTNSISVTAEGGIPVFGGSVTYDFSDGWTTSSQHSNSLAIQTTQGNSISTMGPISSSLGVDHDNDVIYIWLNPVLSGTPATATTPLNWSGLASNSCDPNNHSFPLTIDQAVSGCDPNQFPYPDIVGIPVWCLKNPFNPDQSCAQWLPYTSRSWDISPWPLDANTNLPLGPGLTMRDYADILQADPFVVMNGTDVNVCHPTYGPNLDPNLTETIAAPITPPAALLLRQVAGVNAGLNLADPYDPNYALLPPSLLPTGFFPSSCAAKGVTGTVSRFQPYGAVEYPVPGPNGLASTYTGTFQYSQTQTNTNVVTDSHTVSQSVSVTATGGIPVFNVSVTAGFSHSTTWEQQSSTANQSQSSNYANYSITGPQLTDNYTGPATYNVYMDNVYGTFAFYSDLTYVVSPSELGNIGITATNGAVVCTPANVTPCLSYPGVVVGSSSGPLAITLKNNSTDQIIMADHAVSFSDPGFQVVQDGTDHCSNAPLSAGATCALNVIFSPVPSDLPNISNGMTAVVNAYMVAAGTVNAPGNQNILITNYSSVRGIAAANTSLPLEGATLLPQTQNSSIKNAYVFTTQSNYTTPQAESFTFTNLSNSSVTFPSTNDMILSDSGNFSVTVDGCAGQTIATAGTCTISLQFFPKPSNTAGIYATRITATSSTGIQLAFAGASGTAVIPFTVPSTLTIPLRSYDFNNLYIYAWVAPLTITNNTGVTITLGTSSTPITITDASSNHNVFSCPQDSGNTYFSSCEYNTSAQTTTPAQNGNLANTSDDLIPQPWGYVYGQLGGNYNMEIANHGCSGGSNNCDGSYTPPALTCSATLLAGQSCNAAVVAYLPPSPDDQGWNYIQFVNGIPQEQIPNSYTATFTVPISATFTVGSTPVSYATTIPVTVDGCVANNSITSCVTPGAAAPAALTAPTTGATLTASNAIFGWTQGRNVNSYSLSLGTSGVGSSDLYSTGQTTATSAKIPSLPATGAPVYARLSSLINGVWQPTDYEYVLPSAPALTTPKPSGKLAGSSVTFTWTKATGVSKYELQLGTKGVGSTNLYSSGAVTVTSETVSNLPTDGVIVYARLLYLMGTAWQHTDYTYTAFGTPTDAALTSPKAGSTLTGSSVKFTWTAGNGVSSYKLYLGTTGKGSNNVYDSGAVEVTSETVSKLPTTGKTIYARLLSEINGVWKYIDYTYTAK